MMRKKCNTLFLAVLLATVLRQDVLAMAVRSSSLTVMIFPARYSAVQVGLDLANQFPAVLLTYQNQDNSNEPLLHAWNGLEWVFVSMDDYRGANFLRQRPRRVVLVGESDEIPEVMIDASSWSETVINVPAVDTATLVNSFGKIFSFRQEEWEWYAQRYNLRLEDMNYARRKDSWYDHPYIEEQYLSPNPDVLPLEYEQPVRKPELVVEPQREGVTVVPLSDGELPPADVISAGDPYDTPGRIVEDHGDENP